MASTIRKIDSAVVVVKYSFIKMAEVLYGRVNFIKVDFIILLGLFMYRRIMSMNAILEDGCKVIIMGMECLFKRMAK